MGRREQILQAAYEIVGRAGIEGLHARTVASELGINHAAVHYYYRTRSDLIGALIDYAFDKFEQDREKLLSGVKNRQGRLDAMIEQTQAYTDPHSRFAKNWVSFFVASIGEPVLRQKLIDRIRAWIAVLDHELGVAVKDDDSKPILNAEVLAATLFGIIVMSQACGESYPAKEALERVAAFLNAA